MQKEALNSHKGICVGFLCEYFTCILHVFWILNINAVFFNSHHKCKAGNSDVSADNSKCITACLTCTLVRHTLVENMMTSLSDATGEVSALSDA